MEQFTSKPFRIAAFAVILACFFLPFVEVPLLGSASGLAMAFGSKFVFVVFLIFLLAVAGFVLSLGVIQVPTLQDPRIVGIIAGIVATLGFLALIIFASGMKSEYLGMVSMTVGYYLTLLLFIVAAVQNFLTVGSIPVMGPRVMQAPSHVMVRVCEICQTENTQDTSFCVNCGAGLTTPAVPKYLPQAQPPPQQPPPQPQSQYQPPPQQPTQTQASVAAAGIIFCEKCGTKSDSKAEFCAICGSPLRTPDKPPAAPDAPPISQQVELAKTCQSCGTENPQDSGFCNKCGSPL